MNQIRGRQAVVCLSVILICVALPLFLVGHTIRSSPEFSPIDEGAHYDYVQRVWNQGVPLMGDELLPETLETIACRGVDLEGLVLPVCGSRESTRAEYFPGAGLSYEAHHPPFYYLATAPLAFLLRNIFDLSPLTSTRAVGAIWLVAAMLVMYRAAILFGFRYTPIIACLFAIGTSPVVIYHSSIVSNDSLVLLVSSLMIYLLARVNAARHVCRFEAVAIGLVAGFTKLNLVNAALAVGFIFVFIALSRFRQDSVNYQEFRRSEAWQTFGSTGIALATSSLFAGIAWIVSSRLRATIPGPKFPSFDVLRTGEVTILTILRQAEVVLAPLTDSFTPFGAKNPDLYAVLGFLTKTVITTACLTGLFSNRRSLWHQVGPIAFFANYFGSVAQGLGNWVTYRMDSALAGRFGLVMLPVFALIILGTTERKMATRVLEVGATLTGVLFTWIILSSPL